MNLTVQEFVDQEKLIAQNLFKEVPHVPINWSVRQYILVYRIRVLSVHEDLEEARLALMTCQGNPMDRWDDRRMLCEVIDRKVLKDQSRLGMN